MTAGVLWGGMGVLTKMLYAEGVTAWSLVFLRSALGFLACGVLMAVVNRTWFLVRREDLPFLALYGLVSTSVFFALYLYTISLAPVAVAVVLLYTAPVFAAVMGRLAYGEELTPAKLTALVLTFAGCVLVTGLETGHLAVSALAIIAGIGSAVTYALFGIMGKHARRRYNPVTILFYSMGFATVFLLPILLLPDAPMGPYSPGVWALIVLIAVGPTLVARLLFVASLKHIEASRAAIVAAVEPVTAAILASLALGELLTTTQSIGSALVIGGAVLAQQAGGVDVIGRWSALRRRSGLFPHIGLRARIAILVACGLLALIAIFVVLGLSALRAATDRELAHKSVLAQTAAGRLDSALEHVTALGEWAAIEIGRSAPGRDTAGMIPAFESAAERARAVAAGLVLFDLSGSVVASDVAAGARMRPLAPTSLAALRSGARRSVDWVRADGLDLALVVVPVAGAGGEVLGYLGAPTDLSGPALSSWLSQMAVGRTARVEVVDSAGTVVSGVSGAERLGPAGHERFFADLTSTKDPTVSACYDCHSSSSGVVRERDVMAFAPLQSVGWGVVLRQSEDEVLEPVRSLQQQMFGLGALALLVALGMVWLTTRGVLAPIQSLTRSARRLAEGDLDVAVPVAGSDEIADLGGAIDHMRERLRVSIEEIKSCNADLNRRVLERTAELERSRDELQESRDSMQLLIDRLSTLNTIATALNGSLRIDEVLENALANILRLTSMEAGAIYLVDERTGELELAAHRGISREAAQVAANLGLSASLCASVADTGEPLVVENTGRYARGSRSILLAEKMRCLVRLPFKSSGKLLGTICLGSGSPRGFSRAEMDLLVSVGNQVAVAVEKARLYEELQRKERLRGELLQKVISAQEEERKRIARELHDETSQALAALAVAVETATSQCAEGGDVSPSLARMKTLALSTLDEIHRLVFDLRPTLLDDLGLIAALRWYAETRLGEVGIKVRLEIAGEERRLGPLIETTLYRVVQEAVNNVANHSGAQSFTATLVLRANGLSLTMVDDGWGFDMAELARSRDEKRGLGLMGMKERVELLGGTFNIHSELGQGTTITLDVPLDGEADHDG